MPTILPTLVLPVKDTRWFRGSLTISLPTVGPEPQTSDAIAPGYFICSRTPAMIRVQATAHNVTVSAGFQTCVFPVTSARAAFQKKTATGKLLYSNGDVSPPYSATTRWRHYKALMIATWPFRGNHRSIMKWPGRSDGMTEPFSILESPQAKSHMSMASYTIHIEVQVELSTGQQGTRPELRQCPPRVFSPFRRKSTCPAPRVWP